MTDTAANNRRIAKNTIFLYFRMLITMLVALYTSRVILDSLGIVDFGIYNVVGGMVTMFTFFSSSLSNATQRFLNFKLGENDSEGTNHVFNLSLLIYFIISIVVLITAEIIGLWLLYHKLVIPPERVNAAFWVMQATIISLFITLNGIVFNSMLIAKENMKIYAYIGIIEACAKLAIAFAIAYTPFDKLKMYSVLLLAVTVCIQLFYAIFCYRKYAECKFKPHWDKTLFTEIFKFAGWNGFGTFVWAINDQGTNILLNMFFGPAINAAKGIASQVNSAITNFTTNFFTAVRPQIIKSYACGDINYLIQLIFNSSRFSFYLMLILSIPIIFKSNYILSLWLINVPAYAPSFVNWILIYSIINVLTNPWWSAIQATGNLKKFILVGSSLYLTAFPISYIFLIHNSNPTIVFQALIFARIIYIIATIRIAAIHIPFKHSNYLRIVIYPITMVSIIAFISSYFISNLFSDTFLNLSLFIITSAICTITIIFFFGIRNEEKMLLIKMTTKCFLNSKKK